MAAIRACFKIRRRPVFGQKAGWRGATREHTRQRSVSEEQRSQTAFCPKTLRAAGLLPVAGVGSFLTAHCGDARNSPPWPRPKSLAAGPLPILKQALKLPPMLKTRLVNVALFLAILLGLALMLWIVLPRLAVSGSPPKIYNTATLLKQVQTLSQLVTVNYVLEKVILLEDH